MIRSTQLYICEIHYISMDKPSDRSLTKQNLKTLFFIPQLCRTILRMINICTVKDLNSLAISDIKILLKNKNLLPRLINYYWGHFPKDIYLWFRDHPKRALFRKDDIRTIIQYASKSFTIEYLERMITVLWDIYPHTVDLHDQHLEMEPQIEFDEFDSLVCQFMDLVARISEKQLKTKISKEFSDLYLNLESNLQKKIILTKLEYLDTTVIQLSNDIEKITFDLSAMSLEEKSILILTFWKDYASQFEANNLLD